MATHREQAAALAAKLRDAARMQDPIALSVVTLLKLQMEELKDSLVQASGEDMLRLQGAARQVQKLHKELTTIPPNVGTAEKAA